MKSLTENDDEYIDPNELQYQKYEYIIRNTPFNEFMNDEYTKQCVHDHYINFCLDEIEPLIEKEINLWKYEYEMEKFVDTNELLTTIMHHVQYNKNFTKDYIENNPECVQKFVENKINEENEPKKENKSGFKTYVTPNLNKKFVWETRKYVE